MVLGFIARRGTLNGSGVHCTSWNSQWFWGSLHVVELLMVLGFIARRGTPNGSGVHCTSWNSEWFWGSLHVVEL